MNQYGYDDSMFKPSEFDYLANILLTPQEREEMKNAGTTSEGVDKPIIPMTPADLGSFSRPTDKNDKQKEPIKKKKNEDRAIIWDEEEIDNLEYFDIPDGRTVAQYDIIYKQKVGAEEVFFGMEGKTPSIESCEDLLVKVFLPNEDFSSIILDVASRLLTLKSKKLFVNFDLIFFFSKLTLPLPRPVKDKKSSAEWDPCTFTLSVTLPIDEKLAFNDMIGYDEEEAKKKKEAEEYIVQ
jgi:hypothetical protein